MKLPEPSVIPTGYHKSIAKRNRDRPRSIGPPAFTHLRLTESGRGVKHYSPVGASP